MSNLKIKDKKKEAIKTVNKKIKENFSSLKSNVENGKIKVWSDKVKEPETVRYGWQPFTRANLVNGAGLPASTFRAE